MFGNLSKEDFIYFLVESKEEISYIFDVLDDKVALEMLTLLLYEPASFEEIKNDFSKLDKNFLSKYVADFRDFGLIVLNNKDKYQLTKTGRKFLQLTVQLVIETHLTKGISDEKMKTILVRRVGEKEIKKFQRDRQENIAKGLQAGQFRV
jgi:DNA-binding HxlR family transcriptional regulator